MALTTTSRDAHTDYAITLSTILSDLETHIFPRYSTILRWQCWWPPYHDRQFDNWPAQLDNEHNSHQRTARLARILPIFSLSRWKGGG